MNIKKDERKIINIIRYTPIIFIFFLALITTQIILYKQNQNLLNQIKKIEERYTEDNKKRVKEEIQRVYKQIERQREKAKKLLKSKIQNRVLEAYSIASNIYYQELNQSMEVEIPSQEQILEKIKNALSGMIYDRGRGYLFITDISGNILLEPMNKSLEGKNISDFKSKKINLFIRDTIPVIKNRSEGYATYPWFKPYHLNKKHMKTNYFMYFEALGVLIGSGEYIEDYEIELKENLSSMINNIRFGTTGYVFLYNLDGTCLAHIKNELVGINRLGLKDKNGNLVVKDLLDFTKKNHQGFTSYISTINPNGNIKRREKISYVKLLDDWNWVMGTGFYLDSLDEKINEEKELSIKSNDNAINEIIITATFLTFLTLILSFYFSKYVQKRFTNYKFKIEEQNELLYQQSKMAAMGEMIGNIAHQWRQPLSTISTASTGTKLQKELGVLSDSELNSALTIINDSAQYLSNVIEDFRNFFNPNNNTEMQFNSSTMINKTLAMVEDQYLSKDITIIKNIEILNIFSIENELIQVLINILNNAKDALYKLKDQNKYIFIDSYKEGEYLIIQIKDNAKGIPENIINRIFEPYFTTKHQSQGTGIGLYMSEEIIRVHLKGTLSVKNTSYNYENTQYSGAEFTIKISIN